MSKDKKKDKKPSKSSEKTDPNRAEKRFGWGKGDVEVVFPKDKNKKK